MTLAFLGMETFAFLRWPRFSYKYLNLFCIALFVIFEEGVGNVLDRGFFRVGVMDRGMTRQLMRFDIFLGFIVLTKK